MRLSLVYILSISRRYQRLAISKLIIQLFLKQYWYCWKWSQFFALKTLSWKMRHFAQYRQIIEVIDIKNRRHQLYGGTLINKRSAMQSLNCVATDEYFVNVARAVGSSISSRRIKSEQNRRLDFYPAAGCSRCNDIFYDEYRMDDGRITEQTQASYPLYFIADYFNVILMKPDCFCVHAIFGRDRFYHKVLHNS